MEDTSMRDDGPETTELRIYRGEEEVVGLDQEAEGNEQREKLEQFWAGRNHAMRRSARVAA